MSDEPPEEHRGRPRSARVPENIELVRKAITDDPKLSCRDIEMLLGVSKTTADVILREDLQLRNVYCVWVPHLLTNERKEQRVISAKELLQNFATLSNNLNKCYTVVDETWIYHHNTGKKWDHRAWIGEGSSKPTQETRGIAAPKSLLIIAFTPNKKVFIKVLPPGHTMNSDTYRDFFHDVGEHWRTLHSDPTKLSEIWLQQDNASPHTSAKTMNFFTRRGVRIMKQPPFSPDYNLCDRFLFRAFKNDCRFDDFTCAEHVQTAALQWFRNIPHETFYHEVDKLKCHLQDVIKSGGEYIAE
jgi:hypothetical protein